MLKHTLNIKPLSVNKAWKGRRFKTNEYKDYELEVSLFLPKESVHGDVNINIEYHLKNASLSDIDNPCKPFLDILVKNGIIDDDRKIWKLTQEKFKSETDYITFDITPYEN